MRPSPGAGPVTDRLPNAEPIRSLQVLRAIACCAVVYAHAFSRAERTWPREIGDSLLAGLHDFVGLGYSGVDIFFVLSGFLTTRVHARSFARTGASRVFLWHRILRLVPLYWIFTSLGFALLLLAPALFSHHTREDLSVGWVLTPVLA